MVLNQSLLETIHRRGGVCPPENIQKVYLWMHSGGQTPPLQLNENENYF